MERVEWINRIITILWPHLSAFVHNTLRYKIEPQIRSTLEKYKLWGFKFNGVNFGKAPPRIEGLKVKIISLLLKRGGWHCSRGAFFVVLACHKPVLDGSIDIIKPLSTVLSSAVNKSQLHQEKNSWEH